MILHDHLSDKLKSLNKKGNVIKLFVCGPTVYDEPHLGHIKTYITFDVLAKYLRHKGYSVFFLENITDIDDKIINRAMETDQNPLELSSLYFQKFIEAMKFVKIDSVNFYAPATEHIKEIIRQIKILERRGYTYKLPDGIYYRVWMDRNYGILSGQKADKLEQGKRATVSDFKEDTRDFVLWKFQKTEKEPSWMSPWGMGRPGWHIEDTAISGKYFGNHYDIHGAGTDLLFPHHESELSIMSSLKGNSRVVDFWIYSGLLKINGTKMSKSENNFITVKEISEKYSSETVRMAFLSNNYASETDFSESLLEEAKKNVEYINRAYMLLSGVRGKGKKLEYGNLFKAIDREMEKDLNTRSSVAGLLEVCSMIYKNIDNMDETDANLLKTRIDEIDSYLGILVRESTVLSKKSIEELVKLRENLRKERKYEYSDVLRNALQESGVIIEDGQGKSGWHYELR